MPTYIDPATIDLNGEPWPVDSFDASMRREGPFYTNMPVADPAWVFVDAAGHEHRWVDHEVTNARTVVDGTYWCWDCEEEHETTHVECSICGEHFTPGTHIDPKPFFIDGPKSWTVTVIDTEHRFSLTRDPIAAEFHGRPGQLYVSLIERRSDGLTYVTLVGGPTS